MQDTEYAPLYSRTERMRFVILGVASGVALICIGKYWLSHWFAQFVATAPCSSIFGMSAVVILWYGLFVALPLLAAILVGFALGMPGYRILRDGQAPPLNQKVFHPTRLRRGAVAQRIGYLQLLAFVPLLVIALWGSFQAASLVKQQTHQLSKCAANYSFKPRPLRGFVFAPALR
jgi:hypothetical protein